MAQGGFGARDLAFVGHAAYLQRWAIESERARREGPCELDIRYGQAPGETLDVFPALQDDGPVLVFVHGGYWRALDKSDHSFVAPAFTRHGACVVVPNYDLCPAVTIPHITLQVARAVAWTWKNIARFGDSSLFDKPSRAARDIEQHQEK